MVPSFDYGPMAIYVFTLGDLIVQKQLIFCILSDRVKRIPFDQIINILETVKHIDGDTAIASAIESIATVNGVFNACFVGGMDWDTLCWSWKAEGYAPA